MFNNLIEINHKPEAFEFYTARELWADPYRSKQMLQYHLNESIDASSRNHKFIDRSVEWICTNFELNEKSKIADFGCGPGLYASKLAGKGLNLTGIDFSSNSIEYAKLDAKNKGLDINYQYRNYLEFKSEDRYDLIIMIMCDFCALNPEQRLQLLGIFRNHLKDGGSILLDVYSLGAFEKREESSTYEKNQLYQFWAKDDYFAFMNIFKYEQEKVCLDKYTIYEKEKNYTVYNWLQYFSRELIAKEFEDAGLGITEYLGNVAGDEYSEIADEFAIIAQSL
jgi:SAM-dependent methyltransferase